MHKQSKKWSGVQYPLNYFSKIEDHIILENGKFEFFKTYFIIENNDK